MTSTETPPRQPHKVETLDQVVVKFAGDSGDGMQLTGGQLTMTSAIFGNDLATFPDFPAEIRAPAGTLPGVSAFQVRFSSFDIHTPGDIADVLVAMNPAALKTNLPDLKKTGILIVDTASFGKFDLQKAKYEKNPLETGELDGYRLVKVDISKLTREALKTSGLDAKSIDRCKNMFALGMTYFLFNRNMEPTMKSIQQTFGKKDQRLVDANIAVLKAGWNYCDTVDLFQTTYEIPPAHLPAGTYRNIMGNSALAIGLTAASQLSGLKLFLGSYPITPASDILHQLAGYKHYGVITMQAEDEIAAICAALGAAYAGQIGVTTTSGPGICLKSEAINLAMMVELPLVIVDIQRGGPSTGLPTKTEQADLLQAMYGRNSESPVPIVAASTPADCFEVAIEAVRIALKYMTPVFLLSDGYIANGSEPWRLPDLAALPKIEVKFRTDPQGFKPYLRDPKTLARPWVKPGTPGLTHRIGGIEKQDVTGNVSYDPENHEHMCRTRAAKVAGIASDIPPVVVHGPEQGELLVLGWGSTGGAITGAVQRLQEQGRSVARAHLRHLNPFPRNLGVVLKNYKKVLIPELNLGQLSKMIRAEYLVDAISYTKVQGRPFATTELVQKIEEVLS
jgi:2-oxoglutarate ferredoxin oxidoreductase subunit alpha